MYRLRTFVPTIVLAVAVAGCTADVRPPDADAAPAAALGVPLSDEAAANYRVDPWWPGVLPNRWVIGEVSGLAVDRHDNVWILHRQGSLDDRERGAEQDPPTGECCVAAPPVIVLDQQQNLVRAWGGPGDGYDWPISEHGIHVDDTDHVWIGSNGPRANHVLKFTTDGEFVFQIGRAGESAGSNDTTSLGGPAAIYVDNEHDEVYIADGYVHRRVIVFDSNTGEYKRHWGAYGGVPEDVQLGPYVPGEEPARQFRGPVHGIQVSRDGLVYVADRGSNRIQVFERDGTFVEEAVYDPATRSMGSTWDIELSRDPEQRYIYIPDGTNYKVRVVRRSDLQAVGEFGTHGRNAGMFGWVHNLAMDSHGAIYTSEVIGYKRVQRFVPVVD
jgi:hypothetical protein